LRYPDKESHQRMHKTGPAVFPSTLSVERGTVKKIILHSCEWTRGGILLSGSATECHLKCSVLSEQVRASISGSYLSAWKQQKMFFNSADTLHLLKLHSWPKDHATCPQPFMDATLAPKSSFLILNNLSHRKTIRPVPHRLPYHADTFRNRPIGDDLMPHRGGKFPTI
jgi:hypothetical protein